MVGTSLFRAVGKKWLEKYKIGREVYYWFGLLMDVKNMKEQSANIGH